MPLLSQGSSKLHPIIKKLTKNNKIKKDTGWCSAVSSAMAFAAAKLEGGDKVKYQNFVETAKVIKRSGNIHQRTANYGRFIYQTGQLIKTNWVKGGTYDKDREKGFKAIYKGIKIDKTKHVKNVKNVKVKHKMKNQELIDIFKKDKPGIATSFFYYNKQSNGSYKIKGGHALTVNGYEDGKIKIYDPWGRVYNIDLKHTSSAGLKNLPIVSHVSGDKGFVALYSDSKRKIAFKTYAMIYSNDK